MCVGTARLQNSCLNSQWNWLIISKYDTVISVLLVGLKPDLEPQLFTFHRRHWTGRPEAISTMLRTANDAKSWGKVYPLDSIQSIRCRILTCNIDDITKWASVIIFSAHSWKSWPSHCSAARPGYSKDEEEQVDLKESLGHETQSCWVLCEHTSQQPGVVLAMLKPCRRKRCLSNLLKPFSQSSSYWISSLSISSLLPHRLFSCDHCRSHHHRPFQLNHVDV